MNSNLHEGKKLHEWVKSRKPFGMTVGRLAEKLDISESAIFSQYKNEAVSETFKLKLAKAGYDIFNIYSQQRYSPKTDNSPKTTQSDASDNKDDATPVQNIPSEFNLVWVPLKVQGGFLNGYANRVFMDQLEYSTFPNIKGRCWGFEVEGFSMVTNDDSSLKPGDYVIATEIPDHTWLHRGKTYVFVTVDGLCVKIFDRIEDEKLYLKSANPEYPVVQIPIKNVKKIFFKEGKYAKG